MSLKISLPWKNPEDSLKNNFNFWKREVKVSKIQLLKVTFFLRTKG